MQRFQLLRCLSYTMCNTLLWLWDPNEYRTSYMEDSKIFSNCSQKYISNINPLFYKTGLIYYSPLIKENLLLPNNSISVSSDFFFSLLIFIVLVLNFKAQIPHRIVFKEFGVFCCCCCCFVLFVCFALLTLFRKMLHFYILASYSFLLHSGVLVYYSVLMTSEGQSTGMPCFLWQLWSLRRFLICLIAAPLPEPLL